MTGVLLQPDHLCPPQARDNLRPAVFLHRRRNLKYLQPAGLLFGRDRLLSPCSDATTSGGRPLPTTRPPWAAWCPPPARPALTGRPPPLTRSPLAVWPTLLAGSPSTGQPPPSARPTLAGRPSFDPAVYIIIWDGLTDFSSGTASDRLARTIRLSGLLL